MLWASIPMEFEPLGFKPIKYADAQDKLSFHMPPFTSIVTSKPGTSAIRGGKKDMYFDEAAFIREFEVLFQAALPAITRGSGRITIISTPYGQSGLYHELWQEPKWSHHIVPWWESRFMVHNGILPGNVANYDAVNEAILKAPEMGTLERVEVFGSDKLKDVLHIGARDDLMIFQTEYECQFVDEAEAYFPLELINGCKVSRLPVFKDYPKKYEAKGEIAIGVDLAKKRDETVFTVTDHYIVDDVAYVDVVYVQATQIDYADQFVELKALVEKSHARRVSIDETGPGQMFVEKAQREGLGQYVLVEGITFNNAKKEAWATQFKGALQERSVFYPAHAEFLSQIHGIRRTKTLSNFFKFAGDPDDYFWSLMLSMYGEGRRPVRFSTLGG